MSTVPELFIFSDKNHPIVQPPFISKLTGGLSAYLPKQAQLTLDGDYGDEGSSWRVLLSQ